MTCITWKQPDGLHFNGMCTNKFRLTPSINSTGGACDLCANPTLTSGICSGVEGCADFPVLDSFLLDLGASLTEPAHEAAVIIDQSVDPDAFGHPYVDVATIYDCYPTAAQIGQAVTMKYQSPCSWVYQNLTYRFYQVRVTAKDPLLYSEVVDFVDVSEAEITAPGWSPPFHCSSPTVPIVGSTFCSSTAWGWKWTFSISQPTLAHVPTARIFLERYNARHILRHTEQYSNNGLGAGWQNYIRNTAFTPSRPFQTSTFQLPKADIPATGGVVGYNSDLSGGFRPPSTPLEYASYPRPTVIASWILTDANLCERSRPLRIPKFFDATSEGWNIPSGLPNFVEIPFGRL